MSRGRTKGKLSKLGKGAQSDYDRVLAYQFGDLFDKNPEACRIAQRVALLYSVLAHADEMKAIAPHHPLVVNQAAFDERKARLFESVSSELIQFVLSETHRTHRWKPKKGTNEPPEIHPLCDLGAALDRAIKARDVPRALLTMMGQCQPGRLDPFPLQALTVSKAALDKAIKEGCQNESSNAEALVEVLKSRSRTIKDLIADGSMQPKDLRKLFKDTVLETSPQQLRQWLRDAGFPKGGKGGRPKN